jgi:SMC interacting uncharacterized protein involved in chromosome segregation
VDLLVHDKEATDVQSEAAPLETDDTDGIFFEYLKSSYALFLQGRDDTLELDAQFTAQFEDKNRQIEEECAQVERVNAVLRKDIGRLEQEAAKLPALRSQKAALLSDAAKLADHVSSLETHVAHVERKLAACEKDLAAKKKRFEALAREKEQLQARLAAQEASGVDYGKMRQDQRDLEDKVAKLRTARETAGAMRGEHEIALQKLLEVVEAELRHYNELCMRLRLMPASANVKMPEVAFDLQFKSHARAEEMHAADLAGTIKPALKALRSKAVATNRGLSAELVRLREEVDRAQEQRDVRHDDLSNLQSRVEQQEQQLRALKV